MRRTSLTTRIAALGIAVAAITGVLAGLLAVNLVRGADDRTARRQLSGLADAAVRTAPAAAVADLRDLRLRRRVLGALGVEVGLLTPSGAVRGSPVVARALTAEERATLRSGSPVSGSRTVGGARLFLEGRPIGGGAVVLVQPRTRAVTGGEQALRRSLIAILVGAAVAALLGALVARRLTRPLRRTAAAALALAAGRRDVAVTPSGPVEVAEVAEAVNTLAAALGHSEARQREFLVSVSHELRTPLTAITGYAESFADGVVEPDRVSEVGGIVLAEARRLDRIVGDLLGLARLQADDFRVVPVPVDVAAVVGEAAAVWDDRCRAVGVRFATDIVPTPLRTDPHRLRQVLDGLLENALRVTPAGAPIVVGVHPDRSGGAVVEVRDGGPGLADDDLAVAFGRAELYERYRGVRQVGTGLGLAIVHGLVARLGGTVEAGHAPEGGAAFTVRLPPATSTTSA